MTSLTRAEEVLPTVEETWVEDPIQVLLIVEEMINPTRAAEVLLTAEVMNRIRVQKAAHTVVAIIRPITGKAVAHLHAENLLAVEGTALSVTDAIINRSYI